MAYMQSPATLGLAMNILQLEKITYHTPIFQTDLQGLPHYSTLSKDHLSPAPVSGGR